jgi:hypothetical protein
LDIKETRADFWEFFRKHLRLRVAAGETRLALFTVLDAVTS